MRHDQDRWTPDVWARVYGFPRGRGEGWAGRQDGLYAGKFRTDPDLEDSFQPGNCQNLKEWRVLEFLLPILNLEKPKRISLTMANTLFGAMSRVRAGNWGGIIHEYVEKSIPPHRAETLLPIPLHPPPLSALRLLHRRGERSFDQSGGRGHLQARSGSGSCGHRDGGFQRTCGSGRASRLPYTKLLETRFPTSTSSSIGSRTQPGGTLEGCGPFLPGTFRKPPSSGSTTSLRNSKQNTTG